MAAGLGQAFIDAVMASLGDGAYAVDLEGRVTFLNPAAAELLGWDADELIGREMHAMAHSHDPEQPCPCMLAIATGGVHRSGHDVFVARGGRPVPVSWTATPLLTEDGVAGAVVLFRDISEEREAEEALRGEAHRNELLLHVARQVAAELDIERLVQSVIDAGVMLTRAAYGAFFYDTTDDRGQLTTVYCLSGAPRDAFAPFPFPRNTPVLGPTFTGERTVRFHDVTIQPEYGTMAPYHGVPEGHLPVRSYLAVPVVSRSGYPLGSLFLGHSEAGVFGEDDERLVQGLAAHAAVSLDNARLFAQEQRLAETLQWSMLPRVLPSLPGITAATRYVPASHEADVGGDWYDVIALPDGNVAAVIGDVAGHSVHAATVMGQIRNALRGYAIEGHAPATVMERTNRFLALAEPGEMVTCCYIELDQREATATIVSAGHPPPVLVDDDGAARFVEVAPGPPLGVDDVTPYGETTVLLGPRSVLVLYTDGLIERRDLSIGSGLERLLAAVRQGDLSDVEQLADDTLSATGSDGEVDDDTALLVLAVEVAQSERRRRAVGRRLPSHRSSPAVGRRFVSDVLAGWGLTAVREPVQLLVSELVTNAVLHTATEVELRLSVADGRLRAEVADGSVEPVHLHDPEHETTSGRGLHLVESLADAWGVDMAASGKTVWFEIALGIQEGVTPSA